MTREEARKAAEVMLAYANGEDIEYKPRCGNSQWIKCIAANFDWMTNEYRIKPKEKFDPKTLQPFDKVLVFGEDQWACDFYSHTENDIYGNDMYICIGDGGYVIPYNDDTKHLVGTNDEAPEYYRYWEK